MRSVSVSFRVHRDVAACCRAALTAFAARDRYQGGGEPGDRIRCGECGTTLVFDNRGWRSA